MDYNKVDDPDAFWKYNVDDATKNNAVMSLDKAEQIGDVIMWLNMIAGNWNDGIGKPKKLREAEEVERGRGRKGLLYPIRNWEKC